jgi:hypothetical protein
VSTSPSEYVTAFGEANVPTPGLEGGVGCNPQVTFDGKVRNLGRFVCVLKFFSRTRMKTTRCLSRSLPWRLLPPLWTAKALETRVIQLETQLLMAARDQKRTKKQNQDQHAKV